MFMMGIHFLFGVGERERETEKQMQNENVLQLESFVYRVGA